MVIRTPESGLVRVTNGSVLFLTAFAHDIPDFRILEAPPWASSDKFDITARAPANTPQPVIRLMVRELLATRFGLRVTEATRDMPVDVLRLLPGHSADGLAPARHPCQSPCGLRLAFGLIRGAEVTMSDLAAGLTRMTRRVVADETSLTGKFDLTLKYTPDSLALMDPEDARREFPQVDAHGPALRDALRDQLGLALDTERRPVSVLLVNSVERPTPN